MTTAVPPLRIQACNAAPVRHDGAYVLYWMIACRRTTHNFALQRAVAWAQELKKPLIVFEALRVDYRWASDRLHRFILDGMADNAARLQGRPVLYYPYVEPTPGADKGLLTALAESACVVVTDDFPSFFLPRMVRAAAATLPVSLEQVDSNGLLPLRAADRVFERAYSFRRFLHKTLPAHWDDFPDPDPLANVRLPLLRGVPAAIRKRWPPASAALLAGKPAALARLPIDHAVPPVDYRGGADAAEAAWHRFLDDDLARYLDSANHPDDNVRSELSPYLHFGHISPHQVFTELMHRERWQRRPAKPTGQRHGWWGVRPAAEAFLDQLITWRELGYNMTAQRDDYDQYESLPAWAQRTLAKHAKDRRTHTYSLAEFERAATYDPLWNAAQRQLLREGRIHNYLRMLWGKKILEWTARPQDALDVMIELNNKYAVDGRNPNSYSGIFWVLGRYDRPWGPERPIFGAVRYMTSANTARKLRVKRYLETYGAKD